ncbi:MAG: GNAT family N-acetyltransferase [Nanoarchaeota archaeon]|nr:GNAT family N-acetyltransferase [Nanoarchaeota archaeon]
MEFRKVINPDSHEFKDIYKIYSSSFPPDERRSFKKEASLLNNRLYQLFAIFDKKQLIGFLAIWDISNFIFIENFAIKENLRNEGFGTDALEEFVAKNSKKIVLEIEKPETSDAAKRRIRFYERLGFKLNRYDYLQPPYDKGKNAVPMFLMSHPNEIEKSEFPRIREQLHKIVYGLEKSIIRN